jgi:hypothetical protein
MSISLALKLEQFAELVDSLYNEILLDQNERVEHRMLQSTLKQFALSVKGEITLEESPTNLARALFVQICRMSLSRGRRAVFLEKADEIEREASRIPYTASLYLNGDELRAIADALDSEMFDHHGLADIDTPLKRVRKKLNHLVRKLDDLPGD